jgi:hypothetical protein
LRKVAPSLEGYGKFRLPLLIHEHRGWDGGLKGYPTPLKISKGDTACKNFKDIFAKILGKRQNFRGKYIPNFKEFFKILNLLIFFSILGQILKLILVNPEIMTNQ